MRETHMLWQGNQAFEMHVLQGNGWEFFQVRIDERERSSCVKEAECPVHHH